MKQAKSKPRLKKEYGKSLASVLNPVLARTKKAIKIWEETSRFVILELVAGCPEQDINFELPYSPDQKHVSFSDLYNISVTK